MSADKVPIRWVAPASDGVHLRYALVRHDDMLFSFGELLRHVSKRHAYLALQAGATSPQQWWDNLRTAWPSVAQRTALECQPRDGEVLDLFVIAHEGCA